MNKDEMYFTFYNLIQFNLKRLYSYKKKYIFIFEKFYFCNIL